MNMTFQSYKTAFAVPITVKNYSKFQKKVNMVNAKSQGKLVAGIQTSSSCEFQQFFVYSKENDRELLTKTGEFLFKESFSQDLVGEYISTDGKYFFKKEWTLLKKSRDNY